MVSGRRVLSCAAPPRQRSLPLRLQRRAAWLTQAAESERLHDPPAAVFRSLSERRARTGLDEEWRAVSGPRPHRVLQPEERAAAVGHQTARNRSINSAGTY